MQNDEGSTAVADQGTDDVTVEDAENELAEELGGATEVAESMRGIEKEHYEQIKDLASEVADAESEFLMKNERAKGAKKTLESKQARLSALILQGPDMQKTLPFGDNDDSESENNWRETPIVNVIEATDKQVETLTGAGVTNVGQFEELRAGAGLTSLSRIGDVITEQWENQMLEWLAAYARDDDEADEADEEDK